MKQEKKKKKFTKDEKYINAPITFANTFTNFFLSIAETLFTQKPNFQLNHFNNSH